MEEIVYLNGAFIPRHEAMIPVMDYGFLFGYGLFETMRSYKGRVFRLGAHLDRLEKSANLLGISVDIFVLSKAIEDIIRLNRIEDARIRLTVSAGEGSQTPDLHSCLKPAIFIIAAKYTAYPPEVYEKGYSVVISSFHRNSQSLLAGIKSTCYLESLFARQEAKNGGADDALLLNEKGFVAEASSSNIFTVRGNTIMTPRKECGVLPGITRGAVLEMAPTLSLKTIEMDIRLDELQTIDEAFLTNSLMEIMPLTRINGKPVGSGKPGVTTRKLMVAYHNLLIH